MTVPSTTLIRLVCNGTHRRSTPGRRIFLPVGSRNRRQFGRHFRLFHPLRGRLYLNRLILWTHRHTNPIFLRLRTLGVALRICLLWRIHQVGCRFLYLLYLFQNPYCRSSIHASSSRGSLGAAINRLPDLV